MDRDTEDRVLALAVARGELRLDEVDRPEAAGEPGSRVEQLVQRGRLAPQVVEALEVTVTRLMSAEPRTAEGFSARALPNLGLQAPGDELRPGQRLGRYEVGELIGSGGMGRVYRALDHSLARHAALKVLRSDDPDLVRRFMREAQVQARVDHPNVCQVYEVGEEGGRQFIAMQLITGETLGRIAAELTLEQRVQVVKAVAEAVHEAHRLGLVHRDLKPGNILVERMADGRLQPYVLDFGLALDQRAPGLTRSGVLMGTVQYMAPEQARGESGTIDRRTDVWSLGAVLYELVAGGPLFTGSGEAEVLLKVMQQEAPALSARAPSVPRDLETIVMKCLERDPGRRYESARALAGDLGAFLDGEPIVARPASLLYRLRTKLRKHRAVVATVAVFLVVLAGLVGVGIRGRLRAAERARLAQRFGQEVERMEGFLRYAYALPLHDVRGEQRVVRDRMSRVEAQMRELGDLASGPGSYALGRGHLALGEPLAARVRLQEAWDAGYRSPESAFALGQALAEVYRDAIEDAGRIPIKELRDARLAALKESLQAPALRLLGASRGVTLESPSYLAGLVALLDERFDEALADTEAANREAPWLYEPHLLRGEVFMTRARRKMERGDRAGAQADLAQAGDAFAKAAEMARSDPRAWEAVGRHALSTLNVARLYGGDLETPFRATLQATDKALVARPDSGTAVRLQGSAYFYWADAALRSGKPATEALSTALALGERALGLNPKDTDAMQALGTTYIVRAMQVELKQGADPRPSLERASGYFEKALGINPGLVLPRINHATAQAVRAEYEIARGLDPRHSLEAAARGLTSVLASGPAVVVLLNNLGNVHYRKGQWEAAHGLDPRPSFAQTVAACERAVAADSTLAPPHNLMGAGWAGLGKYEVSRGLDPGPSLDRALAAYRDALAQDPRYALAVNNIGEAHLIRALFAEERGDDPVPEALEATRSLQQVLSINPTFGEEVHTNLSQAFCIQARAEVAAGRDPAGLLAQARAEARRAVEQNPRSVLGWLSMAQAELVAGRWVAGRGASPAPALDRLGEAIERALLSNPSDAECHLATAEAAELRARWLAGHGRDVAPAIRDGLAAADRGLVTNPQAPHLLVTKGTLTWLLGRNAATGQDRLDASEQAAALWQQAVAINPLLARVVDRLRREAGEPVRSLFREPPAAP